MAPPAEVLTIPPSISSRCKYVTRTTSTSLFSLPPAALSFANNVKKEAGGYLAISQYTERRSIRQCHLTHFLQRTMPLAFKSPVLLPAITFVSPTPEKRLISCFP